METRSRSIKKRRLIYLYDQCQDPINCLVLPMIDDTERNVRWKCSAALVCIRWRDFWMPRIRKERKKAMKLTISKIELLERMQCPPCSIEFYFGNSRCRNHWLRYCDPKGKVWAIDNENGWIIVNREEAIRLLSKRLTGQKTIRVDHVCYFCVSKPLFF
jgi:hypothetical protein